MTATLAALALLMQLLLATPCAAAEPAPRPAHAHCEEPAGPERSGPQKVPALADVCCKCVAASVASPPAPDVLIAPAGPCAIAGGFSHRGDAPSLRAIASGPPSQAPPVSI